MQSKRLLVGGAVRCATHGDESDAKERLAALSAAGVDVVVIDAKQGDSRNQIELIKYIKQKYPHLDVIGGNVVTTRQVLGLLEAGVDGVRVGMGVGSASTSQQVKAVGRAQCSSIYHVAKVCSKFGVPVIADGAINSSGGAMKALSMGASVIMMGSLLAGTDESPGDFFYQAGKRLKQYRGTESMEGKNGHNPAGLSTVSVVILATLANHKLISFAPSPLSLRRVLLAQLSTTALFILSSLT
jgi:IMP dehydrogenase